MNNEHYSAIKKEYTQVIIDSYILYSLFLGNSGERENLILVTLQGLEVEVSNTHSLLHMNNCHSTFSLWNLNDKLDTGLYKTLLLVSGMKDN